MISLKFDDVKFKKEMNNILNYSFGFVEGIEIGKKKFLNELGPIIAEQASEFIDSNARVDYSSLHHVYEWYKTGDSTQRLFNINYTVSNLGLSFLANFSQSRSIQNGSKTPFYDKAQVMESGNTVVIAPVEAQALAFEVGNTTVFTKKPVVVDNPGGNTQGQFANVFDMFFNRYFSQAFLRSSGLAQYFSNPTVYKKNLGLAKKGGRNLGRSVGAKWIVNGAMAI